MRFSDGLLRFRHGCGKAGCKKGGLNRDKRLQTAFVRPWLKPHTFQPCGVFPYTFSSSWLFNTRFKSQRKPYPSSSYCLSSGVKSAISFSNGYLIRDSLIFSNIEICVGIYLPAFSITIITLNINCSNGCSNSDILSWANPYSLPSYRHDSTIPSLKWDLQ